MTVEYDYSSLYSNQKLRLGYTSQLNFINGKIYEVDIKSAYLSILKNNLEKLDTYLDSKDKEFIINFTPTKLNKKDYLVFIGNMMNKYEWLSNYLHDYIRYILEKFINLNKLNPINILSIKKDALFIIGQKPDILLIDEVYKLSIKNEFSMYYFIKIKNKKIEIFSNETEVVVKNLIGKEYYNLIKFIHRNLIDKVISVDTQFKFKIISRFEKEFLNKLYIDDLSIYYKKENLIDIGNYLIEYKPEQRDFIIENIDVSSLYLTFVKPFLNEYFKEFL